MHTDLVLVFIIIRKLQVQIEHYGRTVTGNQAA